MSETKFDQWLKLIRLDPPAEFFQEHGRYLDRLVADSKRIDWLIETKCFVYPTEQPSKETWMVCAPDPGDGCGKYDVEGGSTWREAVDNSMESWEASKEKS